MEFKYCSSLKPVFFHRSWGRPRWIFNFLPSLPLKWLAFLETPVICEWLFGLWRRSMITAAGGLQCWDEPTLSRLGKCLWKHWLLISRMKNNVTFTQLQFMKWELWWLYSLHDWQHKSVDGRYNISFALLIIHVFFFFYFQATAEIPTVPSSGNNPPPSETSRWTSLTPP